MASPLGDMKSGMKNPIKKNTFGTVSAEPSAGGSCRNSRLGEATLPFPGPPLLTHYWPECSGLDVPVN
jgi:hypothetical protein